ncbi:separase [Impatiens glandulifera]|uniref:separase n=1 Tax=Impatiens glandulifera TaxID=253017 RepID=UPI001FB14AFD|nr:separase [Impatiens glandulifera]
MDAHVESSYLVTKLQSSNLQDIYKLSLSYLNPFTDFISSAAVTKPPVKPKKTSKAAEETNRSNLRSLAQRFIPFLNTALSIIPKRLLEKPRVVDDHSSNELFKTYELCLSCLGCVSSQLSSKPYSVHLQRVRLMLCLVNWERYVNAEEEGFSILEGLQGIVNGSEVKVVKKKGRFLPELKEDVDSHFAFTVVQIVETLITCVSSRNSRETEDYRRVIALVDECTPWFRALEAKSCDKFQRLIAKDLKQCTLFLIENYHSFDTKLVIDMWLATFTVCSTSHTKLLLPKIAREICSSLFAQRVINSSQLYSILQAIMDSIFHAYKVDMECNSFEFIEFASYCANECRTASVSLCRALGEYLNNLAGDFSQRLPVVELIMNVYATGLLVYACFEQSRQVDATTKNTLKDISMLGVLFDDVNAIQNLTTVLNKLKACFCFGISGNHFLSINCEHRCSTSSFRLKKESCYNSSFCELENRNLYVKSYCNALRFLCQPLAERVHSERKELVGEIEANSVIKLRDIQAILCHFCDVFHSTLSELEFESNSFDDTSKIVLNVIVASLTLSYKTKLYTKEIRSFVKLITSADWIQPTRLKYLSVYLHNIGVTLYRDKQLEEASVAIKLCCRALWARALQLCKSCMDISNQHNGDMSTDTISDFVAEASDESAFLLQIHHSDDLKSAKVIRCSLENWSTVLDIKDELPSLVALIKKWVKIECRHSADGARSLYSLVSPSATVSIRTLGIIQEQELIAYREMNNLNPKLCKKMRIDIMDLLLQKVYVTHDTCLKKTKILIAKGQELSAHGTDDLNDSIKCLSDALYLLNNIHGEKDFQDHAVQQQIAVAYSLRALYIQKAQPNSKPCLEDIQAALGIWLTLDGTNVDKQCGIVLDNLLVLCYHILDMLTIKGYTQLHPEIYELLIRLNKWKNLSVDKYLGILWESRRLGHVACASPISEAFIMVLSQHCGELSKSIHFWLDCLKGSRQLELGFQQMFYFVFSKISQVSFCEQDLSSVVFGIDEVKAVALELASSVPFYSSSAFLAAHLYHDLSGRLISTGRLCEGLLFAKEALRLRHKLLQEKFIFSVKQQTAIHNENGDTVQKGGCVLDNFQFLSATPTVIWSSDNLSYNMESLVLTPWNVLQCYLESILQVSVIHESMGNRSEAESLLVLGKDISCSQGLPFFTVAFSCIRGTLYGKQRQWEMADKELESAKQVLEDSSFVVSCPKCKLIMEVMVNQHIADLYRCRSSNAIGGSLCAESLSSAENLYKLALDKLKSFDCKNSKCHMEESIPSIDETEYSSSNLLTRTKMVDKQSLKEKNASTSSHFRQGFIEEKKTRVIRSTSSLRRSERISRDVHKHADTSPCSDQVCGRPRVTGSRGQLSENSSSLKDATEAICICNKKNCWHCLLVDIVGSGCMENLLWVKWELLRRQVSFRILRNIGKCYGIRAEFNETHEILVQSISVLVNRNAFSVYSPVVLVGTLLDLVEKDIPEDPFAIERATILYDLTWFILRNYPLKHARNDRYKFLDIPIPRIVALLMRAFVLCCEVPLILHKVSQLLCVMHVLCASVKSFSLPLAHCKVLSVSQWASYFHQASLGTHHNHQQFSCMMNQKGQSPWDVKDPCQEISAFIKVDRHAMLRHKLETLQDLERSVSNFFQGLPCTPIICISLLGDAYGSLLTELLASPSPVLAWTMLTRLNSKCQPVVLLLPANKILEDNDANFTAECVPEVNCPVKRWHCPWGSTVVDDVAPPFRQILEENYCTASNVSTDTKFTRSLWWNRRKMLDQRLSKLLRDIEDLWLGPWKCLLLGEWSNCKLLNPVEKKLMRDLKTKYKLDVHESLLKIILSGTKYYGGEIEGTLQLILNKGCFIGGLWPDELKNESLCNKYGGTEELANMVSKLILEASQDLVTQESLTKEPLILVLDFEIQMLPWESLPVLRTQEVYRMPSVGSIYTTLERCHTRNEKSTACVDFPQIDPMDAFYLLNPDGDLTHTQLQFEKWFRDMNFEGKVGTRATEEELSNALRDRDLFLYFGHGSGSQYISRHEIQKLRSCAATLLMGCSSGSLSLDGCYTPQGAPLSYLLAGSPVIVSNLWEVTDKDIDRFGKVMIDCWLRERSENCDGLSEELKGMQIGETKLSTNRKSTRKKTTEASNVGLSCQRPKLGSFMTLAREACTLPFLIGAAPVCYGVPTHIVKKKIDLL